MKLLWLNPSEGAGDGAPIPPWYGPENPAELMSWLVSAGGGGGGTGLQPYSELTLALPGGGGAWIFTMYSEEGLL